MPHLTTLRDWLATLSETQLTELVDAHPLVQRSERVRDLDELAARLTHPSAVSTALAGSPLPLLQVVETTAALGLSATTDRLRELLDGRHSDSSRHDENVRGWLGRAFSLGLVWPDGERLRVNPGIARVVPAPLALGNSASRALRDLTVDTLRTMARALGVTNAGRKDELIDQVGAALADPATVRRRAAEAPDEVLAALTTTVGRRLRETQSLAELVAGEDADPDDETDEDDVDDTERMQAHREERSVFSWLASAGLAFPSAGWGYYGVVEVPTEVYLALAPAHFRVPFSPQPPQIATRALAAEQVGRSAAAAASEFLATAMAVLEELQRQPLKAIKSGGIGSRELARHAKAVGAEPSAVRLTLTVAVGAGLLDEPAPGVLTVGDGFADWRRRPPAERAADLCAAWLPLFVPPTLDRDVDGKFRPVLSPNPPHSTMPLGLLLCRLAAELPGQEVLDPTELLAAVAWRHPLDEAPPGAGIRSWAEAHHLGLLADGAITPLGDAIVAGNRQRAAEVLDAMLPEVSGHALIGSDQTILVPGTPDPTVVDVLDVVATRETRGAANTWRVSPESVRSALDSGYGVEDLIRALEAISHRQLPQAMGYLMRDVARKHGHLTVRAGASAILSEDESLLAEVVATRGLRGLVLQQVAPTVALSSQPPEVVLNLLRSSGYLPVMADGGTPTVQFRRLPDLSGRGSP